MADSKYGSHPWKHEEFMIENQHMSNSEMARIFGGTEYVFRRARKKFGMPPSNAAHGKSNAPQDVVEDMDYTPEERFERDKLLRRVTDERQQYKRLYETAVSQSSVYEILADIAHEKCAALQPVKLVAPSISKSKTVEDAIMGWADWHGGESISRLVMQGYNEYNPAILCRRAQTVVDKTVNLLLGNHSGTTFENLFVFDMGDGVAGDLLSDNATTNALGFFSSMVFVADVKARALAELSAYFNVIYIPVPGNHGRHSRDGKMPWKQPHETADWLIANMIRDRCINLERVDVKIPTAWTALVNVRGFNHSLNHGYSAAKGGYGGVPWYAFQRADGKKTALESAHDQRVHYRWYGHIHTPAELPKMDGFGSQFIVGTLAGGNEYALEELNAYGEPKQLLVGCHEKHGTTWRYPLDVRENDNVVSRYEDALELLPTR